MQPDMKSPSLLNRFKEEDYQNIKICIIGLGYVGLPLAVRFARYGFMVHGIDIDKHLIKSIQDNIPPVMDVTEDDLKEVYGKTFFAHQIRKKYENSPKDLRIEIAQCDIYIICVPTPLMFKGHCDPDPQYLINAKKIVQHSCELISNHERLIILESTTYPGCTDEIMEELLESNTNIYVGYSPERTNPGDLGKPFYHIKKIIGAMDNNSDPTRNHVGHELLTYLYTKPVFLEGSFNVGPTKAAELVKCAENGFRLVSISFANQLARHNRGKDFDLWGIIGALNIHQEKNAIIPLPGYPVTLATFINNQLDGNVANLSDDDDVGTTIRASVKDFFRGRQSNDSVTTTDKFGKDAILLIQAFYKICDAYLRQLRSFCRMPEMRIDFKRVVEAMLTKPFGLNVCSPGPGAGGHCIPVDPLYLLSKAHKIGAEMALIWEAIHINEEIPSQIIELMRTAANQKGAKLNGSKILLMGLTYKKDVPDTRESKARDIMKMLLIENADIFYCDPVFINRKRAANRNWQDRAFYLEVRTTLDYREVKVEPERFTEPDPDKKEYIHRYYVNNIALDKNMLRRIRDEKIDVICILTDHTLFKGLYPETDMLLFKMLATDLRDVHIIDTRNVVDPANKHKYGNLSVWGK